MNTQLTRHEVRAVRALNKAESKIAEIEPESDAEVAALEDRYYCINEEVAERFDLDPEELMHLDWMYQDEQHTRGCQARNAKRDGVLRLGGRMKTIDIHKEDDNDDL